MKNFLKIVFIFLFCLLFSNIQNSTTYYANNSNNTYIQNDYQRVILVAQNFSNTEISTNESNTSQHFSGNRDFFIQQNNFSKNSLTNKYESETNTNSKKILNYITLSNYIRAP